MSAGKTSDKVLKLNEIGRSLSVGAQIIAHPRLAYIELNWQFKSN